jgi:hypothetical protein
MYVIKLCFHLRICIRHQGLEHTRMLQMHRSLEAYFSTLNHPPPTPPPPPPVLDVPTFAARYLHVHKTREILAAKGGNVGENVGR